VFPLLRKRQTLLLLPDQVLYGEGMTPLTIEQGSAGYDALLAAFTAALLQAKGASRRKLRISLCVADSLAAIVELPWQPALVRAAEIDRYAEAQFEHRGQGLDGNWVMFSYFRHYAANGIAYALPADFVRRLQETALSCNVIIDSLLPLSAFAYARQRLPRRGSGGAKALIVREPSRVTALVAGRSGLMAYATEPVTGNRERSVERLLRRLHGEYPLDLVEHLVWEVDGIDASPTVNFWRL
jgi:hypothetical protein